MSKAHTVLYLCHHRWTWNSRRKLAGVRRFASSRGWDVEPFPPEESRPEHIRALLTEHQPVGCIVDRAGLDEDIPLSLFGRVPAVYLDPPEPERWSGAESVVCDNAAVADFAYRELAAGLPAAFAAVPSPSLARWNRMRIETFRALCDADGHHCHVFQGRRNEASEARVVRIAQWLGALPRRTAVFAVNDNSALDVVKAAQMLRRHVPREIAILGVDGMHYDESECVGDTARFSSIVLDVEYAGYAAAKLLASSATGASFGPLLVLRRESTGGFGRREPRILKAVEIIRGEATAGLTAAALAARFPGSRKHFERRFREAIGHSVLDEILHVRMTKVLDLLSQPKPAIGAIADFCGFTSDRELRKLFHSRHGISMRQWRNLHIR
jgi:DNA-binding LacI/PurR family transcriptional regulator